MLRFKKLLTLGSLLMGLSCSIVKDSDVTSLDQLNQLKLSGIEIVQDLNTASPQTYSVNVTDSLYQTPVSVPIDINNKINGSVVKQTTLEWPVFSKTKMIFRSKISSGGIEIKNYFYTNGRPRSSTVYQNNKLKEWYSFYYDINWKLTNIRSRVYTSIPSADTTIYKDSLIYNSSGYVASLVRKSPTTPSKAGTLNLSYQTYSSNSAPALGGNPLSYSGYNYSYSNCNCPNGSSGNCFGANLMANNGSFNARYIISSSQTSTIITQLQFEDIKNNGGNCGGSNGSPTDYDTYYFHPLMLLRGLFTHGDILLNIYAVDWWQPGSPTNNNPNKNETVTFNFKYAR
ncbi:MAG: hypothetical protein JST48_02625 [Bacteroidetes bacterium]|nr:hypothetical protein [Bacteroidota bacterium]